MIIEFNEQDSTVFEEIMEVLKQYPEFKSSQIKEEPMISFSGLEIYSNRRKICRDHREIKLTVKEYDILCLLVANKGGMSLHMTRYMRKCGEKMVSEVRAMLSVATFATCGKNCTSRTGCSVYNTMRS